MSSGSSAHNAPALALSRASATPDAVAVRFHELGIWRGLTWGQIATELGEVAGGLRSMGARSGDAVGLVMANHASWIAAFLGIQAAGCVAVPVHPDLSADETVSSLEATGAVGVIAGDQEQFDKVDELQQIGRAPTVRFLVVVETRGIRSLDHDGRADADRVLTLAQLRRRGTGFDVRSAVAGIHPSDPAVWIGGVVESHDRELTEARQIGSALGLSSEDRILAQASLADPFERGVSVFGLLEHGLVLAVGEGGPLATAEANAVQPTLLHAAPGYLEAVSASVSSRIKAAKGLRKVALSRGWKPSTPPSSMKRPRGFSSLLLLGLAALAAVMVWFIATPSLDDPLRLLIALLILILAFVVALVLGVAVTDPLRRQLGFTRTRAVVGTPSTEAASLLGALGVPLIRPDSIAGDPR